MAPVFSRYLRIVLWLSAAACVALSLLFMFNAGCAGDVKGGTLRDIEKAMDREGSGVLIGWLGLAIASTATACTQSFSPGQRIGLATAIGVMGLVALTILGIQFEVWGVQSCFSHS